MLLLMRVFIEVQNLLKTVQGCQANAKFSINLANDAGDTLLIIACRKNGILKIIDKPQDIFIGKDISLVRILLNGYASTIDLGKANLAGNTPLHVACICESIFSPSKLPSICL